MPKKQYLIKDADGHLLRIYNIIESARVNFYCIFDTLKEANEILKSIDNTHWHIEEGYITEVAGSKPICKKI